MPIYIGTSSANRKEIIIDGKQMQKVYVGDKLVWQKLTGPIFTPINNGLIYNSHTFFDSRKLANADWDLPTIDELDSLVTFAGGLTVAGGALKSTGFLNWNTPNTGAIDSFGLSITGSGLRQGNNGNFSGLKTISIIPSKTKTTTLSYFSFSYDSSTVVRNTGGNLKTGYNVRLIYSGSDTPTSYIGNDGKIYEVVNINGKYWTKTNLAETKYRNEDTIPEVKVNATWQFLATGALCAYDNDWSNV